MSFFFFSCGVCAVDSLSCVEDSLFAVQVLDHLFRCWRSSSSSHHISGEPFFHHMDLIFTFSLGVVYISHRVTLFFLHKLVLSSLFSCCCFPKISSRASRLLQFECSWIVRWRITWRSVCGYLFAATHHLLSGSQQHFLFGFSWHGSSSGWYLFFFFSFLLFHFSSQDVWVFFLPR